MTAGEAAEIKRQLGLPDDAEVSHVAMQDGPMAPQQQPQPIGIQDAYLLTFVRGYASLEAAFIGAQQELNEARRMLAELNGRLALLEQHRCPESQAAPPLPFPQPVGA